MKFKVLTEEMGSAPEGLSLGGEGSECDHGSGEGVHYRCFVKY